MSSADDAARLDVVLNDLSPHSPRRESISVRTRLRAMLASRLSAAVKDALHFWLQRRLLPARNSVVLSLPVPVIRLWYLRTILGWTIGEGTTVERGVRVIGFGSATIGCYSHINSDGTVLDSRGELVIGDHVDIGQGVRILTADHAPHEVDFTYRERRVDIGNRVWVATGVVVLPGSRVDDGAICAAGSIVRGHLESDGIYAGNPVRRVADRARDAQSCYRPARPRW